ncbi:MAG TPA: hypothetical protein VM884_09280 [Flavisolibacter sp.]|jgi:hypothetical protein|nr:hypothetical protein [Flavisolibacter sp.]
MKSLASCLTRIIGDGYTEDFKVTGNSLESLTKKHYYAPDEIHIVNFFRFEGESDPDDNAILYVIEAADGTKGTLLDSYGTYSDADISRFMQDVTIQKKTQKN